MNEIDEFERSNTNRFIFTVLGLVVGATAIGLGIRWIGGGGSGVAEQDKQILLVTDGTSGLGPYAAELGFDPTAGTLDAWREQVAADSKAKLSASDVQLEQLLEFADLRGFGYVVLTQPSRFSDELQAMQIELPAGFDAASFAVVSVGDFADPHVLSIDPPRADIELDIGSRMLLALFAQPRLTEARDGATKKSDLQTTRLALDEALEDLDLLDALLQRSVDLRSKIQGQLDGITRVDGKVHATPLTAVFEGASMFPLADGRVIVRSDAIKPVIDGSKLTWRGTTSDVIQVIAADAPARADARVACPELDSLTARGSVRGIELSRERDTMLVLQQGDVGTLFTLDPSAGPCGLRSLGELSLALHDNSYIAVGPGRVGVRERESGMLSVHAYTPGSPSDRPLLELTVTEREFSSAASLIWLDPQHLAVLAKPRDGGVWAIVFVDIAQPERTWIMPLSDPNAPALEVDAAELQGIPGTAPALLLRWQNNDNGDYVLSRLDFPKPWPELISAGIEQAAAIAAEAPIAAAEIDEPVDEWADDEEAEAEPPLTVLAPAGALAPTWTTVVRLAEHMRGYDVDLSGSRVAYTIGSNGKVDVGMVALPKPGEPAAVPTMLVADETEHREVSFRPGHDELVFRTRLRIDEFDTWTMVAHALAL